MIATTALFNAYSRNYKDSEETGIYFSIEFRNLKNPEDVKFVT